MLLEPIRSRPIARAGTTSWLLALVGAVGEARQQRAQAGVGAVVSAAAGGSIWSRQRPTRLLSAQAVLLEAPRLMAEMEIQRPSIPAP